MGNKSDFLKWIRESKVPGVSWSDLVEILKETGSYAEFKPPRAEWSAAYLSKFAVDNGIRQTVPYKKGKNRRTVKAKVNSVKSDDFVMLKSIEDIIQSNLADETKIRFVKMAVMTP